MTTIHPAVERADALIDLERYDEAAALLAQRIAEVPADVRAWAKLSRCHLDAGRPDEALAAADEALRLDPEDVGGLLMRSYALRRVGGGRMPEVEQVLREVVRIAPEYWLGHALLADARQPAAMDELEERRGDQRGERQQQHRRLRVRSGAVERLLVAVPAADEHGRAQHEQDVPDDRADDRRLDDLVQPLLQGEEGDDQLGGVAEGDVEEAADAGAAAGGELLGGAAHQRGGRDHAERGRDEDQRRRRVRELEHDRDDDERHQQIRPAFSAQEEAPQVERAPRVGRHRRIMRGRRSSGGPAQRAIPFGAMSRWAPPTEQVPRRTDGPRAARACTAALRQ